MGRYGFRDCFAIEAYFDATDGFVANFNVEEHFVGDERTFSRKNDIGKEKEREKQKR
jgi:hypothetical protein